MPLEAPWHPLVFLFEGSHRSVYGAAHHQGAARTQAVADDRHPPVHTQSTENDPILHNAGSTWENAVGEILLESYSAHRPIAFLSSISSFTSTSARRTRLS